MSAFLAIVAGLGALALFPFLALLAAILAAALVARLFGGRGVDPTTPPRFLVVIPAHDEEALIAQTIRSVRSVRYDPERYAVHVIADNCTDRTADQARAAGATVFERTHATLRSKGHALEQFFRDVPEARPETGTYDAAILVDADTEVDPDAFTWFARSLARGDDWVQGYYTVANADATWRTRLMTYAFSLVNGVWMLGLDRLGVGVGLKGNGMCFRRTGLQRCPWRAHGLVEDMEFAWMLRLAGERVRFQPRAIVRGEMVSQGGSAAESQRIRWESGRAALRSRFRRELWNSDRLALVTRLVALIELHFPPLGTLAVAVAGAALTAGIAVWTASQFTVNMTLVILGITLAYVLVILLYIACPFVVMRLPLRHAGALAAVPWYLAWKLVRVAGRRPGAWVRTPRESISTSIDATNKGIEHNDGAEKDL